MWAVVDAEASDPAWIDVVLLEAKHEDYTNKNDGVGDNEAQLHFKPSVNWKCDHSTNDESGSVKIVVQIDSSFVILCHEVKDVVGERNGGPHD